MNPRFLRQKPSGHIYPWTAALAARPDMEPYEPQKPRLVEPKPEAPPKPLKPLVRKTTEEQVVALFKPPETQKGSV